MVTDVSHDASSLDEYCRPSKRIVTECQAPRLHHFLAPYSSLNVERSCIVLNVERS